MERRRTNNTAHTERSPGMGEKIPRCRQIRGSIRRIEEGKTQIATWIADSVKGDADQLRKKGYTFADIFEAGVKHLTRESEVKQDA